MRLDEIKSLLEQVTIKQFKQSLILLQVKTIEMPRVYILELCDTIEALQQQLNAKRDFLITSTTRENTLTERIVEKDKQIKALQQENERLKLQMVQAARGSAEIVDLAAENVKLQQENEIFRADIADANTQMAHRDKVIEQLQAERNAWKQAAEIAEKLVLDAQGQNAAMREALIVANVNRVVMIYLMQGTSTVQIVQEQLLTRHY